jgi:chromosome segregation ATPase
MPLIPIIIAIFGGAIGGGGVFYGRDQYKKRMNEKAEFEKRLKEMEARLKDLIDRLGKKDKQVRDLCDEIEQMRRGNAA